MALTWRQTSKWGTQSGCGQYRIAKSKCGPDLYRYLAYAKIDDKWALISKAVSSADEAKEECTQWHQSSSQK